ncbi:MAG: hypothetical protein ACETWM_11600 [Candidatus Lokiarchaeia archaeon]
MKRHIMGAAVLALLFLMCYMSGVSLAQEEELEYSWGRVSSLSSNQIIVKEYDYESDEDVDVTYVIDPKVKIENVNSLEEITVGDSVGIDFVVRDSEKVAKVIIVEKSSYEEEYTPEEEYEEEPEEEYEEEPEYFPDEIE